MRGLKRQAEEELSRTDEFATQPTASTPAATSSQPQAADPGGTNVHAPFEALLMSKEQLENLAQERADVHPLLQLQAQADLDRWDPTALDEDDHGTWDGRWSFICERDWKTLKDMGKQLPCGSDPHDAFKVQAARKEYVWSQMTPSQKKL